MSKIAWPSDNRPSDRWSIYTRGNVGEVYPEVVFPLEWSIAGLASENGWRQGAMEIGFLTERDFDDHEFNLVAVFGGYAYFNASLMRLLGVRTPGLSPEVIDQQFLGQADVPAYSPQPGDRNLRATIKVVGAAIRTLRAKSVPRVETMRQMASEFVANAPALDEPDEVLWQYVTAETETVWTQMIAGHVANTMHATISAGQLTDFCQNHLGDPNLAVTLSTGIGNVVSAEPARAMWRLANEVEPEAFDAEFSNFLADFGHRGPNEFSLAGRDWSTYPDIALGAIEAMRGADPDRAPQEQDRRVQAANKRALDDAHKILGRKSKRLDKAISNTALWSRAREDSKDQVIRVAQVFRSTYRELHRRAASRGGANDLFGPMLLTAEEFRRYLDDPKPVIPIIEQRRQDHATLTDLNPPFAFDTHAFGGSFPPIEKWDKRPATGSLPAPSGTKFVGSAGAPGTARGPARVVTDPGDPSAIEPGDILIAPLTDPAWTPLFLVAAGVVVEVGAAMSHSMIISRELGIPCVVGLDEATLKIADGAMVEIDGQTGTVQIV